MLSFRKFLVAKKLMDKREGEVSRFSFENFLSHSAEKKFVGEPFRVSLIRVSKNLMLKRVMSRFFGEFFLSHSTETFRRGTLLCSVSENFW